MGLFSKKSHSAAAAAGAGGAGGDGPMHFTINTLPDAKIDRFKEEFDHAFGRQPQVVLTIARPPADVAAGYAADGLTDRYLTVAPRGTVMLSVGEKQRVEQAARAAGRAVGSSVCVVREKGGFGGVPLPGPD